VGVDEDHACGWMLLVEARHYHPKPSHGVGNIYFAFTARDMAL
jgi:hypothetical protein